MQSGHAASPAIPEPMLQELRERVLLAARAKSQLRIVGSGSHDFLYAPVDGEVLDAGRYSGIVEYEPTELVITARCGTPIAQIESALAEQRQHLPFEPPSFGDGATIGGVVAMGLSGPRRAMAGSVSDYVLGAVLLDGRGQVLRFGGQVMKNVAGYDVSRLLCGSRGVLGLIAEVSLKVLPAPQANATLAFEQSQQQAIDAFNRWAGQPLPISATWWYRGRSLLRLSGSEIAVRAGLRQLGGEVLDDSVADSTWSGIRHQRMHPFGDLQRACWRLSLPSTMSALDLPGEQAIEWGGAQRWWWPGPGDAPLAADRATALRTTLAAQGASASLWSGAPTAGVSAQHPPTLMLMNLHRRIKDSFDPHHLFNRGRLFEEI